MTPFALIVELAASSLEFMFWGAGLFVMPLKLIYTLVVYRLFHGGVADVGYEQMRLWLVFVGEKRHRSSLVPHAA
jgi:hypothetical protein